MVPLPHLCILCQNSQRVRKATSEGKKLSHITSLAPWSSSIGWCGVMLLIYLSYLKVLMCFLSYLGDSVSPASILPEGYMDFEAVILKVWSRGSNISITGQLIKTAHFQASLQLTESETLGVVPKSHLSFFFGGGGTHSGMQDLISPTRDWTHAPCIGSTESSPLDLQGGPTSCPLTSPPGDSQALLSFRTSAFKARPLDCWIWHFCPALFPSLHYPGLNLIKVAFQWQVRFKLTFSLLSSSVGILQSTDCNNAPGLPSPLRK